MKNSKNKTQTGLALSQPKGVTLVELLVVISILIIIIGLTTINVLNARRQSIITASAETFITDLKQQQLKAMTSDTEGRSTSDNYGIYFGTNTYTLFHGTYSSNDPSNSTIKLGDNLQFSSIGFPSSQILFLKTSGEVSGSTSGSIKIKDIINNVERTIIINRYGIITGIN